ncbi:MAG TPA: 16S rRNA (cytosine(1402)-N(4))-methyltransferase RsmH [Kofleriaceae bacterium]|nr:16S rRNA (cytosine(1402)-N(4))-methyltransferase RsmH [Kofleriaceae bacterium]
MVPTPAPHVPVMPDEVLLHLAPAPGRLYCDGTVGAGGHAERVLEAGARVIGLDRDPAALAIAGERLARFGDRVTLVHATYDQAPQVLAELAPDAGGGEGAAGRVDGLVLDLGLSSIQLDDPERGFSFSRPGPIDMRMDPSGGEPTALELIRRLDVGQLAAVLRDLGEERYHKRIAARLKEDVRAGRLRDTGDLARAVTECIPEAAQRRMKIHPATLTFQALRIAVNRELDQLAAFLEFFPDLLADGGRCVVISFHSLEDRMVKHRFRDLAWSSSLPPHLAEQAGERVHPICRVLTRKAVVASEEEVRGNPRARSARLRACERLPRAGGDA